MAVNAAAVGAAVAALKHAARSPPVPPEEQPTLVRAAFEEVVWPALEEFNQRKAIRGMPASADAAWQLAAGYTSGGHAMWFPGGRDGPARA